MKVLLVHPPTGRMVESILPAEVEGSRGASPPLGILYLAAAVRERGVDAVEIIDAQAMGLKDAQLETLLARSQPDVVGVTALSFTMPDALAVARLAKRLGAITVLGGPHPHIYPERTAGFDEVDYVVRGEGERAFVDLLDAVREGRNPVDVSGAGWFEGGEYRGGPGDLDLMDVDKLPLPARDLTDVGLYSSVLARTSPITTIMSSRGCPYRCLFCDRPHLGRKFRARSPQSVADEIGRSIDLGIREFLFYDDNFTTDRERALAICDEIRSRGYRIHFDVRARVNDMDEEVTRAMKAAGLDRVHMGVESGDADILETLRKGITLEGARRGFKLAKEAGILTLAYFMFGAPGETAQTAAGTVDFAMSLKPDYVHFSTLVPFPATELYALGLERGIWERDLWAEFARNPRPDFQPPLWEENLDRRQLTRITLGAYKKFYRNPSYVYRRLRSARAPGEIIRQLRAGMRILKI